MAIPGPSPSHAAVSAGLLAASLAAGLSNPGTTLYQRGDLEGARRNPERALAIKEKEAPGSLRTANSLGRLPALGRGAVASLGPGSCRGRGLFPAACQGDILYP